MARFDPMSPEDRELWLRAMASDIRQRIIAKYMAGQIEHKHDLGEVSIIDLLDHIEQEAIDTICYVQEIKRWAKKQHESI